MGRRGYSTAEMRLEVQGLADGQRGPVMLLLKFAVLQRLQAVREDVTGELALVRERGAAVHAGVQPGRAGCLRTLQFLQPNK